MRRPKLIILVGLPGSGKTTYANQFHIPVHLSSDTIREELYGDESTQGSPNEVFSLMQKRAVDALNNGQDVIYDATNLTRKDRAGIINVCPKFVEIECHVIWAPIEVCIERDSVRKRTVGSEIIDRMVKRFQPPFYDEGIDCIRVVLPEQFDCIKYDNCKQSDMNISHDNPHHTLNIYDHCERASKYLMNKKLNDVKNLDLIIAALEHDVGKPYVKSFTNAKGESTDIAHYYNHDNVGSYISYGLNNVDSVFIAWLIGNHMGPFLNTKYYNNLPPYLKKYIDIIHEADLAAH